jgi:two-component system cell cycle sensor histidine kinase/response regulator CckA
VAWTNFKRITINHRTGGPIAAVLVFVIGFALLAFDSRLSRALTRSSYDWSFGLARFATPELRGSDVVIIYIDEESLMEINRSLIDPMKRRYHAELLDRLAKDGAKAVAMDIMFTDPGPDSDDEIFATAIRSNGRVVLGVDYNRPEEDTYTRQSGVGVPVIKRNMTNLLTYPYQPFLDAAKAIGLVVLNPDNDFRVRRHFHKLADTEGEHVEDAPPSLSWATARVAGLKTASDPLQQVAKRWIYYYGPPGTIPHVSYKNAYYKDALPPGFFHDKVVFIGARPITAKFLEKRDEWGSPYRNASGSILFMPMVEIHATQYLNLQRGDWLSRPSPAVEITVFAVAAIVLGFGLVRFRPWTATVLAVIVMLAVLLAAQTLFAVKHVWFAWLIIVAVQVPSALLFAFLYRFVEWYIQRRKLEEERRRADARIREQAALLDKAQDAILVHDFDWHAHYWNPRAERLYGWTFDEVKHKNLRTEVLKTDEAKSLEALQTALAKGEWSGELNQTSKDGKPILVQSRWTLVRDEAGKPASIFVINTDITEQKKLEAQFLRTQRMESIGTLAGGIAHDLNNVLSPILMGVELMRVKAPDEFSQKMLNTMASSAKRGSDMVKQVLAFARGTGGERTVLQISHLIREMQKIVKETFPKTIDFKTTVADISPILGDATQVHQIILNLCVNARDAMPDGGGITVSAKNVTFTEEQAKAFVGAKPINYVLLSVSDTGTGIPTEIIDKIFEPFFTTKEIGKGTGLGLSTVISIIKSHDGFLDLQTQVGKGTSFNVYLPAANAPVPLPTAPTPPEALWGKGETVMVVDDEPAVLELTKNILTHYGYKVVTAIHGADALALYSQYAEKIKVVLMDMMMPVMDGAAAIRALRHQKPNLPCIAISGLMQSDKLKEQLGGADVPFIPKPYTTEYLLENLRKCVTQAAA